MVVWIHRSDPSNRWIDRRGDMGGPTQKGIVQYAVSSNAQVSFFPGTRYLCVKARSNCWWIESIGWNVEGTDIQRCKTDFAILVLLVTFISRILLSLQISEGEVATDIVFIDWSSGMNITIQRPDMLIWQHWKQRPKQKQKQPKEKARAKAWDRYINE